MKPPQMFQRKKKIKTTNRTTPIGVPVSVTTNEKDRALHPATIKSVGRKMYLSLVWKVLLIVSFSLILLSSLGYINDARELVLRFGKNSGGLIVSSEYIKANVYLDGVLLGQTPFTGESVKEGNHTLTLKAVDNINDYFIDQVFDVKIYKENTTIVKTNIVPLQALSGYTIITSHNKEWNEKTLAIKGVPSKTNIIIDGVSVGSVPLETSAVLAGTHQVKLESDGYKPIIVDLQLIPEKTVELDFKLYKYQISLEEKK